MSFLKGKKKLIMLIFVLFMGVLCYGSISMADEREAAVYLNQS